MRTLLASLAVAAPAAALPAAADDGLRCPAWTGADYRPLTSMELAIKADPNGATAVIVCRYRIGTRELQGRPPCRLDPVTRTLEAPPTAIVQICAPSDKPASDCSVTCTGR